MRNKALSTLLRGQIPHGISIDKQVLGLRDTASPLLSLENVNEPVADKRFQSAQQQNAKLMIMLFLN